MSCIRYIKTPQTNSMHLSTGYKVYDKVLLTCVVKQTCDKGAVPEEGVSGGDVLKVALLEHGVFKHHGLHLQVEEPVDRCQIFELCCIFIKT